MMTRYGKSSAALFSEKKEIFLNNAQHMPEQDGYRKVYIAQPRRTACMCCGGPLNNVSFTTRDVDYLICPRCKHLNGGHQDTDHFCRAVYRDDGGTSYAVSYHAKDFEAYSSRVDNIYGPKAEFLFDALGSIDENIDDLSYADLGAGSGYFVSALQKSGRKRVVGYEISEAQVAHGNHMLGSDLLIVSDTLETIPTITADVVSLIGVLEHLQNPRNILAALQANTNIRFVYISVPLFSPTVFFEMAFPDVELRQLAMPHTHLYTEASLQWMYREFDLDVIADWWFGADMVDLMRSIAITLSTNPDTRQMTANWQQQIMPLIDSLQLGLDQKRLSSEVHVVLQVKR